MDFTELVCYVRSSMYQRSKKCVPFIESYDLVIDSLPQQVRVLTIDGSLVARVLALGESEAVIDLNAGDGIKAQQKKYQAHKELFEVIGAALESHYIESTVKLSGRT